MKRYLTNISVALGLVVTLTSCEGKVEATNPIIETTLIAPENDKQCLGVLLPTDQIRVLFDWEDVAGVSSFLFEYEDTILGETKTVTVTESRLSLDLEPGTQYKWSVTVLDFFSAPKKSVLFSFYTEGLTTPNHVPFPANTTITTNENGTVTLNWESKDLDNDIDYYQIFFSPENPPTEIIPKTEETTTSRPVDAGLLYYLTVKTYDKNGNFSESKSSFQF